MATTAPLSPSDTSFDDPHANKGHIIYAVGITLIVLAVVATVLRFLSRKLSNAGFWWDDWMILAALPLTIGLNICLFIDAAHGLGKHAGAAGPPASPHFFKVLFPVEIMYNTCVSFIKFSVLLFYLRIFPGRQFRRVLWPYWFLVVGWGISMNSVTIFQCIPIHKTWNQEVPGRCVDLQKYYVGQAIPNIITDGLILLLPIPLLLKLQIPKSQKIALIGVFMLGGFVIVVSIIRLTIFLALGAKTREDITWNYVYPSIWSSVEPSIGLVSACLPSMRYLFKQAMLSISPKSNPTPTPSGTQSLSAMWARNRGSVKPGNFQQLNDQRSHSDYKASALGNEYQSGKRDVLALEAGIPLHSIHVKDEVVVNYD